MNATETRPETRRRPATRPSRLLAAVVAAILVPLTVLAVGWHPWSRDAGPSDSSPDVTAPAHDVEILSVDFDPPPGSPVASDKSRALLVVVDNRGTESESKLLVEADVLAPGEERVAAQMSEPVTSLAAGEVRVVRFESLPDGIARKQSWLKVQVKPAEGSAESADAAKTVLVDWASILKVD